MDRFLLLTVSIGLFAGSLAGCSGDQSATLPASLQSADAVLADAQTAATKHQDGGSLDALQAAMNSAFVDQIAANMGDVEATRFIAGNTTTVSTFLESTEALIDVGRDAGALASTGDLDAPTSEALFSAAGGDMSQALTEAAFSLESTLVGIALGSAPNRALDDVILASQDLQRVAQDPAAASDPAAYVLALSSLVDGLAAIDPSDLQFKDPSGLLSATGVQALLSMVQAAATEQLALFEQIAGGQLSDVFAPSETLFEALASGAEVIAPLTAAFPPPDLPNPVTALSAVGQVQMLAGELTGGASPTAAAQQGLDAVTALLGSDAGLLDPLTCGLLGAAGACAGG